MPRFAFEAIDAAGALVRGTMDADTRSTAVEQLLAGGQTPVLLKEARSGESLVGRALTLLGPRRLDYVLLLRELATLLKAGLTVERAFVLLQGLSANAESAVRLKQILDRVRGGEPLSRAFGAIITEAPAYVGRLIAAGEASGQLPDVVGRLAAGLVRARSLRDKLVSSLTYPLLLIAATFSVLALVFTTVLPRLTPMFAEAGVALPWPTQLLLDLGWFVQWFGLPLLLLAVAAAVGFVTALRRPDLRLVIDRAIFRSRLTLEIPARVEAVRFCRNLETLLEGGLSLERALGAARDGGSNSWFRERIGIAQIAVADGERLRRAFDKSAVLPPLVLELAGVGEETGRLAAMMGEASAILDDEVTTRLDRLTALVLPVATLTMGGIVGAIMAGIVSGILAVNDLAT
jgi:general secretion pathway protein F